MQTTRREMQCRESSLHPHELKTFGCATSPLSSAISSSRLTSLEVFPTHRVMVRTFTSLPVPPSFFSDSKQRGRCLPRPLSSSFLRSVPRTREISYHTSFLILFLHLIISFAQLRACRCSSLPVLGKSLLTPVEPEWLPKYARRDIDSSQGCIRGYCQSYVVTEFDALICPVSRVGRLATSSETKTQSLPSQVGYSTDLLGCCIVQSWSHCECRANA